MFHEIAQGHKTVKPLLRFMVWLALSFTLSFQAHSFTLSPIKTIKPCIQYQSAENQHIHIIRVQLQCPQIHIIGTPLNLAGSTTSNFAYATQAVVATNGSFFQTRTKANGLIVSNGVPWPNSQDNQSLGFLACTKKNQCIIDDPKNISPYQSEWNTVVSGWQLLKNKQYRCAVPSRTCINNAIYKHPRTIVGLNNNGSVLYLVNIEGRLNNFKGYSLKQAAKLMHAIGASTALNLDGGSSATMVINQQRVNQLSATQLGFLERNVANHLGITWSDK